ncbi:MAG: alanine--tRNA ligase [Candidatus Dormibacteraeota bacterium]|nr:alanine--tRNA ligase [Candidatus Dormibacteraeota bacterium]
MTGAEIRRRFLEHFQDRGHLVLASASLVPQDDPTTLFISAGMQPLQPYYQGLREPPAGRLVSSQKCFRTDDLEEVGRTDRHHTFFEMLGNFAPTGDYFNERAIPWAWEFVTDRERGLGLPSDRIRVVTHPSDERSREIWRETGVRPEWVYESEDNWWGLEVGPCGPDTELWWDRGGDVGCGRPDCYPDHCARFLEFWNLVLPQYDRRPDGSLPRLPKPAVDTGMGLDRVTSIVQGVPSIFDTDLFAPLLAFVREAAVHEAPRRSERIVADHLRAMTFVIGDGVLPGNEGRGYVLRRVIRRAALHARRLSLRRPLAEGVPIVVAEHLSQYPELGRREADIVAAVAGEQAAFERTLAHGMELFEQLAARAGSEIPGADAFHLHDTFGFPLELTLEMAEERGLRVDREGFDAAMNEQRRRSRGRTSNRWPDLRSLPSSRFTGYEELAGAAEVLSLRRRGEAVDAAEEGDEVEVYLDESPFYAESGGQVGDAGTITGPSGRVAVEDTQRPFPGVIAHLGRVQVGQLRTRERVTAAVDAPRRRQIMRHHTATHLLNKALEELLQRQGLQRGSWVGPDHTTFDFPLDCALSSDELRRLQGRVNEQVRAALPLHVRVLPYSEALGTGATHLFDEKYGDEVRVVCFADWSCEFCGGTHSPTSADVGFALILGEQSIGQGLRRIDLAAGVAAEELVDWRLGELEGLARRLGVPIAQVGPRVEQIRRDLRTAQRDSEKLRDEVQNAAIRGGEGRPAKRQASMPLIAEVVADAAAKDLGGWADRYLEALGGSGVAVAANEANFVVKVSRDLAGTHPASALAARLGRGGGGPTFAQGRLAKPAEAAFADLEAALK